VLLRLINRLFGRKDLDIDAVNAFVEGSASPDEQLLVEKMMRENPALEKDLSTQRALLGVLDRVDNIEAPRSFAVTPEMVAAANRSESIISRFAELFAPQRKLALAPAIIAGFAALSVALLTIGDISGVVDQTSGGDDSGSIAVVAESAALSSNEISGEPEALGDTEAADAPSASSPQIEMAVEGESPALATTQFAPPAIQPTPAAGFAAEPEPAVAEQADATTSDTDSTSLASPAQEPLSIAAEAPLAPSGDDEALEYADNATTSKSSPDSPESITEEAAIETAAFPPPTGDGALDRAAEGAGTGIAEDAGSGALEGAAEGAGRDAGKGISLPLRQLQVALAALAVAAIGAWAGLRRVRGE
jgi:hypothetical protein